MESSVPGFEVCRVAATPEGLRETHNIEYAAHKSNNDKVLSHLMWPDDAKAKSSTTIQETQRQNTNVCDGFDQDEIKQILEPDNSYWLVVEEATGLAVAYAFWQHHRGKSEKEWNKIYNQRYRPVEMNHAVADTTEGVRSLKRARIMGNQDCMSKLIPCVLVPL